MRVISAILVSLCAFSVQAHAQAWTLDRGGATVTLSFGTVNAAERFDHEGDVVPFDDLLPEETGTAYSSRRFAVAAEYGLLDDLTIYAEIPLRLVSVLRPEDDAAEEYQQFDFGDLRLGFRMALEERLGLPDASSLTVGLGFKFPMGYRRNVVPVIGSGQVDADILVSYGHLLLGDAARVEARAGYRFRSGIHGFSRRVDCTAAAQEELLCFPLPEGPSFSDELVLQFQAGYTLLDRISLTGLADVVWSVEEPQPVERFAGAIQPDLMLQRRGVAGGAKLSGMLFEGAHVTATLLSPVSGQNILAAPGLSFGFEIRI